MYVINICSYRKSKIIEFKNTRNYKICDFLSFEAITLGQFVPTLVSCLWVKFSISLSFLKKENRENYVNL